MTIVPTNCTDCGLCCFTVVMLKSGCDEAIPEEMIRRFDRPAKYFGMMHHKASNECVAWDRETKRCTIYENRPEACRTFPQGSAACQEAIEDNMFRGL